MKHIYLVVFVLFFSGYATAQNMQENTLYFESSHTKENGNIEVRAKETYLTCEKSKKNILLETYLANRKGEIIFVSFEYYREIWKKNPATGQIDFIGSWDLDNPEIYPFLPKMLQTTKVHPWFFYIGGQVNFDSSDLNALFLSVHVGSFLWKDRWDLSLSGTFNMNGNTNITNISAEIGLQSKFYYPIRKYNISPYIGAGISRGISSTDIDMGIAGSSSQSYENYYWNYPVLTGLSWYVGSGSWDFGLVLGRNFNATIGYTFSF